MAQLVIPDVRSLHGWVGSKLGSSDWLEITQQRIDLFAEATGDKQWIHVDPERAKRESPFGGTIAHGHLTLALAPFFFAQILEVKGVRMIVNPGIEHMRLRAPVRAGDRVRMHATLKDLRDLPGGAIRATLSLQFEVEGQSRPAAFGDAALVYYP
jgi:acyl dehydratase